MSLLSKSIFKRLTLIIFFSVLLAATMIVGVDLFRNLETYSQYSVPQLERLKITLLAYPQAIILAIGPCCLFSVSYLLSMMHADNEIIAILNAGINYNKIIKPCMITAVFVSVFCLFFNETVGINSMNEKDARMSLITNGSDSDKDNTSIAMSDYRNGIVVYAKQYINKSRTLYTVSLVEEGDTVTRHDAYKAVWNEEQGCWDLFDVYTYTPNQDSIGVNVTYTDKLTHKQFSIEPELFRNMSDEVSRMDLDLAIDYVARMKELDPVQYAQSATDLFKRLFSCLTPLVMVFIATRLNYRFKKNILFFALICSLCIAVVYYVVGMITNMMASQGLIYPALGPLLPLVFVEIASKLETFI